jgi:hypothetical protein
MRCGHTAVDPERRTMTPQPASLAAAPTDAQQPGFRGAGDCGGRAAAAAAASLMPDIA